MNQKQEGDQGRLGGAGDASAQESTLHGKGEAPDRQGGPGLQLQCGGAFTIARASARHRVTAGRGSTTS